MSASVFLLVLFAAALHAGWNAIVKGADDKFVSAVTICFAAAFVAALTLPFVAQPARASWPYLGASMMLQTIYYSLVAAAYKRADMSLAYPVMRGTAPMIVALVSGLAFAEYLPQEGWIGVALISGGILSMAFLGRHGSRAGLGLGTAECRRDRHLYTERWLGRAGLGRADRLFAVGVAADRPAGSGLGGLAARSGDIGPGPARLA